MTESDITRVSAIFRGLADPGRLKLMLLLQDGEKNVGQLVSLSNERVVNVSSRLRELHHTGLLKRHRKGRNVYYSLTDAHIAHIIQNALEHGTQCEKKETL